MLALGLSAVSVAVLVRNRSGSGTEALVMSHVHGLGVDPSDGALIVATHLGSFRLPKSSNHLARIGASYQDTMGFTVEGPNRYLGSGHPDVPGRRSGQPTQLGLIESTNAGVRWSPLSLSGEVDFHGLAVAHGLVYGWDATTGRFMVSSDRANWDTRSTFDDLEAFAIDPQSAEHIVAATSTGLRESLDGGRTWNSAAGPPLVTLSWDVTGGLWGADAQGQVWHEAGTKPWERVGALPGEAQVILATNGHLYAAVSNPDHTTSIVESPDGAVWQVRYRERKQ